MIRKTFWKKEEGIAGKLKRIISTSTIPGYLVFLNGEEGNKSRNGMA
ncbi:MAG TPA: hypothetical protein ACFYEF_10865 [Candidatus Wunengus sp. YC63]